MVNFPNSPVRQRIGLDDHRYLHFTDQLRDKGYRNLGCRNGIPDGSEEDQIIKQAGDFVEIYDANCYHLYVSESARCFYTTESGD